MAMASIAQLGLATTTATTLMTTPETTTLGAPVMMQQPPAHIASAAEAALNEALGLSASLANASTAASPAAVTSTTQVTESYTTEKTSSTAVPQAAEVSALDNTDSTVGKPTESGLDAKEIKGMPTLNLLVHNMFDKDEETDEGWQDDIREDFEEECSKYGKIQKCVVMHLEPGGKIYVSFDTEISAKKSALALAGRWFDKRQLRVEYIKDEDFPNTSSVQN